MATLGEIVYMALDILKERSDDAYYTEEHMAFLAKRMRSLLLEKKYTASKMKTFLDLPDEDRQTLCMELEPGTGLPLSCGHGWLRTTEKVPQEMPVAAARVYPVSDVIQSMVTLVPVERMPYVGHNRWLRDIIWCARSDDGHYWLRSTHPEFMMLERIRVSAVFSDPEEVWRMQCRGEGKACDPMAMEFPLEGALIPQCVELMVQEIAGSRYAPEDKDNDARDGLGRAAVTQTKAPSAARNTEASR